MFAWISSLPASLLGSGVDAERVERFEKLRDPDRSWPLIFSLREEELYRRSADPARSFCAAFCCKEALMKALGGHYPFPSCELLAEPDGERELTLDPALAARHGIAGARARFFDPGQGELLAVVSVLGAGREG